MINPFQTLFDFTLDFYNVMESLWEWFSTDIELLGLTFTPFDMIFNWITLSAIIIAVLIKKVVPLT
jgi:hypothetical protein